MKVTFFTASLVALASAAPAADPQLGHALGNLLGDTIGGVISIPANLIGGALVRIPLLKRCTLN
jgi:hypothetical protein